MDEFNIFRESALEVNSMLVERTALETQGMALVLSGAIPPYIDLTETATSVRLVLNNPASLQSSKGTDDGLKCLETGSVTSSGADGKLGGEGGEREPRRATFLRRSSTPAQDAWVRQELAIRFDPRSSHRPQKRRSLRRCCPGFLVLRSSRGRGLASVDRTTIGSGRLAAGEAWRWRRSVRTSCLSRRYRRSANCYNLGRPLCQICWAIRRVTGTCRGTGVQYLLARSRLRLLLNRRCRRRRPSKLQVFETWL